MLVMYSALRRPRLEGGEGVYGALAEHHVHLHGEVQQDAGDGQADHAVAGGCQTKHQGKRGQDHGQQRGAAGETGIGEATGDGCRNGANRPDQREYRDLRLRQAMMPGQLNRHGGPEQAERREQ
jgi:hypothetical protein